MVNQSHVAPAKPPVHVESVIWYSNSESTSVSVATTVPTEWKYWLVLHLIMGDNNVFHNPNPYTALTNLLL